MNETCVCCGQEVPEGRLVCKACELRAESGIGYGDIINVVKSGRRKPDGKTGEKKEE